ncbi:MAG: DUF4298 domain-containing protein [Anaerococcus vaginalis]|uniref:DUF4298 domain-containing protein n=1 Tax=Anaerococcus vaginalis TaxID=33037 RepID=UPI00288C368C|nr:DUF4298 domain-containing protein [Anaerococcus vaginalis]MDU4378372.1 DUF4298 domain-containing protein [Anaerococcus vaginalis]MDU5342464.1 DUF4298 domain-containing protein [Anaerococcus vaginalis]MDU5372682.1 DUF4298 domain-containing protein [Anaerococcus vaginalis]MDU5560530.1 DUF4298 domain-containing protein [Anaerococcus vaginalis]MDU5823771.1 DUF4298 domain-containing protein [Anaerococcus vaginalis]
MVDINKIKEMEEILNKNTKEVEDFRKALEKFKNSQKDYKKLSDYYSSEEYMKDLEESNQGKIDPEISQGIFSEDLVYDLLGDNYYLAVDMLELATEIIKNN